MQKQTGTKVIGQKTSGAMLSAIDKKITDKYPIIVPIADFYMADGQRIEQKGVVPDVKIDTSKALEFTLDELIDN
ncbi:MAG: S41 family peptidase [Bacteroidota bacterium]